MIRLARLLPAVVLAGCMARGPAVAPSPAAMTQPATAAEPALAPPPPAPGPGFGPPGARLDSMDYAVYSAVLREVAEGRPPFFVVMDSTRAIRMDAVVESLLEREIGTIVPEEGGGLVSRLAYVSEGRYPLQPALLLDAATYRLMSETEFRALFGVGPGEPFDPHPRNGWAALARQHPGAEGRHEFSRVAYDHDRTLALVFYEHRCGNVCANVHYVVLRRQPDASWRVVNALSQYTRGDDHTYDGHDGHQMADTVVAGPPPVRAAAPDSTRAP